MPWCHCDKIGHERDKIFLQCHERNLTFLDWSSRQRQQHGFKEKLIDLQDWSQKKTARFFHGLGWLIHAQPGGHTGSHAHLCTSVHPCLSRFNRLTTCTGISAVQQSSRHTNLHLHMFACKPSVNTYVHAHKDAWMHNGMHMCILLVCCQRGMHTIHICVVASTGAWAHESKYECIHLPITFVPETQKKC